MSIAKKLTTIAENVPKVYQAGQDSQQPTIDNLQNQLDTTNKTLSDVIESWTMLSDELKEIRNEIRNLNVDVSAEIEPVSDAIPEVYEAGKKSQYDEFWDSYQNNGNRTDYRYAFAGWGWNKDTYNPKYPLVVVGGGMAAYMFSNSNIEKIGDIDLSKVTGQIANFIRQNTELTEVGEIVINNAVTQFNTFIYNNASLVTIKKLKIGTVSTFTNAFNGLLSLVNITIDGIIAGNIDMGACPLSKASIISVVNALSASKSGLTVTFLKTAVNNAFGINVDDVTTYPEGSEFYILRNSKSNWTFSYA